MKQVETIAAPGVADISPNQAGWGAAGCTCACVHLLVLSIEKDTLEKADQVQRM